MSRSYFRSAILLSCVLAIELATPLQAQVTADPPRPPSPDAVMLDAVQVTATRATTATKTDMPLAETPQSISVVTAAQIADRGAIGMQEALRYSAGVRTEPNGADARFDYFTARGGFDAAEYLDGLSKPVSFYTPRTDVYTLERIEILRGPSSVLYGQGAAGGIVNAISKRPQFQRAGEISLEAGSYDRKQLQFDATGALDAGGTLAGRIVGVVRDAANQVDFGRDDRVLLMPSLRYQPGENTDIVLTGLYQQDKAASIASFLPVSATLLAPPGRRLPDDPYLGEPRHNFYDQTQTTGSLLVSHRFSDRLSVESNLRYNRSESDNGDLEPSIWDGLENPFLDDDRRILPRYRYDARSTLDMVTSDNHARLDFATGALRHSLLVGVDYRRSKLRSATAYGEADPIDIYAPVYGNVAEVPFDPTITEIDSQLGVYLQDQIRYADRVTLVLGARRDRATTRIDDEPDQVDRATTLRAGLIVDVGANVSPYLSYSESFQPTLGLDFYGRPFVPQEGTQREVGVKWQPTTRTLVSVAGFDIRGTNRPETDPSNGENQIQQGEVTSRGYEVEITHATPGRYEFSASLSHVNARIGKSTEALEIGLPISAVPSLQASAWAGRSWRVGDGLVLRTGLGARRVGPSTDAAVFDDGLQRLRTPGFTLVDALAALEGERWSFAVNATNLLDKSYYASCAVRSACSVGYRRNVVGTLTWRF